MPQFKLPDDDASPDEVYQALAVMNAIKMTVEQFESAYTIYTSDARGAEEWVLRYFREAGLLPVEAALEIIKIRIDDLSDYYEGGFDVFGKDRNRLLEMVETPITYEDIGFSGEEMDDIEGKFLTGPPLN